MIHIRGYYYIDSRNREVFHVPYVFTVIDAPTEPIEVILEPRKLKSPIRGLRRVLTNAIRDVEVIGIHESDIQRIVNLCFSGKEGKAEECCEKLFDKMIDCLSVYYNETFGEEADYEGDSLGGP